MTTKIGLVAFGVTTCVLVPTALHALQAGPQQVEKLVAPDETSFQVGDAKVDVVVDKGLVADGSKVRVTVTATSDKRVKVPVALLVYEQEGMAEGRTEAPPYKIGRDEVTLDVKDGKASKTFTFTLPGNHAVTMDGTEMFGHYTVLAMSPKAADQLEAKRRRAQNSGDDPAGFFHAYENLGGSDDDALAKDGQLARLDINTTSPSKVMSIIAGDTAVAKSDITVKVRVKNPTKAAYDKVDVTLESQASSLAGSWLGIAPENVEIVGPEGSTAPGPNTGVTGPTVEVALAAHETKDLVFHVKTSQAGTLGLFATMKCDGDDCYDGNHTRIDDAVLEAIDIMPAPKGEEPTEQAQADAPADALTMQADLQPAPQPAQPAKPVADRVASTTAKNPELK